MDLTMTTKQNSRKRQTGSALFISLIILVLMMLIGTTAMQTTVLEEKMSGNTRDQNNAFQAAEAGLLDGERDLHKHINSANIFSAACDDALCLPSTTGTPQWLNATYWGSSSTKTRVYGAKTGAKALVGVAAPPRYMLEELPDTMPHSLVTGKSYSAGPLMYRVTARGSGAAVDDSNAPLARVMLQTVYRK